MKANEIYVAHPNDRFAPNSGQAAALPWIYRTSEADEPAMESDAVPLPNPLGICAKIHVD